MEIDEGDSTNPYLLARAGDWRDHRAWLEIIERYEPMLSLVCRQAKLSGDETNEVLQRVWIDLARRLLSFRYDPTRRFRGFLATLCRSRIIDVIRERNKGVMVPLSEIAEEIRADEFSEDKNSTMLARQFEIANEVQQVVRAKVNPETWDAFWLTSVENLSLKEAGAQLGKTRAAIFEAQNRVRKRLRIEGVSRLAEFESSVGGAFE